MINKNRNRGKFTFANINLLGKCNADCYFCLGKDIADELRKSGGFIPGIRPGISTEKRLKYLINRVIVIGSVFLGLIAVSP